MKVEFSAFPKALSGNVALFVAADKELLATAHAADAKANGALTRAFEGGRFTGAKNQTLTILGQSSDIARLLLLGVGMLVLMALLLVLVSTLVVLLLV